MDKLNREIWRLSWPTILSNVTIPLLGICDTAISGHLGSELYLSAIAVGTVMLNVVFWIFGFLRGGTTGLTANALGKGDQEDIGKVLYRALMIALGAGILLIVFNPFIFNGLWILSGGDEVIKEDVAAYFTIRILGSPALLAIIAISGWFVGMQNTFFPMLIAISTNIINMAMSYLLVFPLGRGFIGVAEGTLISNWVGLIVAIICMLWFLRGRMLKCSLTLLFKGEWTRYFSVNGNLFLRSLFIICVTMGVTAAGAGIGNLALAVNIIVMQFFQFFSFFIDGFAYSGEAMVGLQAGKNDSQELDRCVRRLLKWTMAGGLLFSVLYLFGAESITALLTDSHAVRMEAKSLTLLVALIPIVSCWAFIYDGFYVGITATFQMMFSTLLGGGVFFIMIYASRQDILPRDNFMIWVAFLSYLLIRGIYLAAFWRRTLINHKIY